MRILKAASGRRLRRRGLSMAMAVAMVAVAAAPAAYAQGGAPADGPAVKLVVPSVDPAKGKRLFVERGCVLCHSVNKFGGRAGPPLVAPEGGRYVDLLDFMARMWRGSFAMIELQGMELGYQLDFTGEELGHIAAFLADASLQKNFGERDVPDLIRDMFIQEPYDMGDGLQAPGMQ
jgi:mono/diheme cytochrome c family protein